jgi:hypothetical protein
MKRKNSDLNNPGQIIIPAGHPNPPEQHEIDTAEILALHYRTTVEFLKPIDDYKRKSADIKMLGVEWELKCPTGASKSTIQTQFQRASKQAVNIIIDSRRTRLKYDVVEKRVQQELKNRPYMKKAIIIDKSKKVIEIQS